MGLAQVQLDEQEIQRQINERLDQIFRDTLILWDINEMSKRLCMSKSFLEENILHDPRMRLLERRKQNGKRFWFYEQSVSVIRDILDEW